MSSQLPDPTRSGPFEPRRRSGRGWLVPALVALVAFGAAAALGFDRLEHVFASGPDSAEDALLLGAIGIGSLATLLLLARLVRPKVEEPLAQTPSTTTYTPASSVPSSTPTASSMPVPPSTPRSAEDRARQVRRTRMLLLFVVGLAPLILVTVTVYNLAQDSSSTFSSISKGIEANRDAPCPRPSGGADAMDSERTDCLPLDGDEVFEVGPVSIQGTPYVSLKHDDERDCGDAAAVLDDTPCTQVVRGVYETEDRTMTGAVSIVAFPTKAVAEELAPTLDAQEVSLAPNDAAAIGWTGPEARGTCIPSVGRYVTCIHIARDSGVTPEQATVMARHLNFVATDVLVARRFELL